MSSKEESEPSRVSQLEAQLVSKEAELRRAEDEVIKLSRRCADLVTKELKSGTDDDSWSLGSAGSLAESDSAEVKSLKEKLIKLKQNEEYLNYQLEVLKSTVQIMVHPDDIENREKEFKSEISELKLQLEELLAKNMSMKVDISQVEELKQEVKRLHEANEKKTALIEELHEKLANYGEQNSVLLESLQETTSAEESLRDSLTRIQSTENVGKLVADNAEVKQLEETKSDLLHRLNSLEDKDTRLRDRLEQVEEHEQSLETEVERLQEELALTKDINANQEQTILDLQEQLMSSDGHGEKQKTKKLKEELELTKDISSDQEQTILELQQQLVESDSNSQKQKLKTLEEELALTKDINTTQEQTIINLQEQLVHAGSTAEGQKSKSKITDLEKKCSNMKLIMSQKMEELEYSRKTITSLENSVADLQATNTEVEELRERAKILAEELSTVKELSVSQEETIKGLQLQVENSANLDLAESYHDQLAKQLSTEDMEEMQAEYHKETLQLRKEIDSLNCKLDECLSTHQPELIRLQEKLSSTEDELHKSNNKLSVAHNVIQELKTQNKKISAESKKDHEERLRELNAKLQGEKVQNSVHRDVIASMSPQIEKLSCENESLEANIKTLKEKLSFTENDLAKRKAELESGKSRITSLERKNEDNKEEHNLLQSEFACIKQKLDQKTSESDNLAVDLIEITDKCGELEKRLSVVTAELQSMRSEKIDLHKHCDEYSQQLSTLSEISNSAEQNQAKLEQTVAEYQQLETELRDSHAERSSLQQEYSSAEKLHQEAKVQWDDTRRKLEETVHQLTGRIQELQESLDEAHQHKESLGKSKIELEKNLSAKLLECQSLAHRLSKSESQLDQYQSKQQTTLGNYQSEIAALHNQMAELQALIIVAAKDLQELEGQRDSLLAKLDQAHASIVRLKSENQDRQEAQCQLAKQLSDRVIEVGSLKSQIGNLDSELKHVNHENERTTDSLKKEIYGLTQDKSSLQNRNDKLVIQVDEVLSEKQVYIDEIEKLASTLKLNKTTLGDRETELLPTVGKLGNLLNDQSSHRENELDFTTSESSDSIQENLQTIENKAAVDREPLDRKLLEQTLHTCPHETSEAAYHKLEFKLSELQNENGVLLQQVAGFSKEIDDLKQSLEEERNKGIYLVNKQAERHKADLSSLQDTLTELHLEREELKHQIVILRNESENNGSSEITALSSQIEQFKSQNTQFSKEFESLQEEHVNQLSIASAEKSILQAQLENMNEIVEQLHKEAQLKNSLQILSSELQNRLRDEKKDHATTSAKLDKLTSERLTYKEKVEDLKEKYEHSLQQCKELRSDLQQADDLIREVKAQLTQKTSEKAEISCELVVKTEAVEKLLNEKTELELNLASSQATLTETNQHIDQLKAEKDRLERLTEQLEGESLAIRANLTPAESVASLKSQRAICGLAKTAALSISVSDCDTIHCEQDSASNHDSYIHVLQSELKMVTDELASTKKENDDLSSRVSDLYNEHSEMSQRILEYEKLQDSHDHILQEFDHLKDSLDTSEKRVGDLTNQLNILESKKLSLEDELDSLRANNINVLSNIGNSTAYAERCNELENQLRELEAVVKNQRQANLLVQSEKGELIKRMTKLSEHSADLDSLKKQVGEKEQFIATLEKRITSLTAELDLKSSDCLELKEQLALKSSLENINSGEQESLRKQIMSLESQLQDQVVHLKAHEEEKAILDRQVKDEAVVANRAKEEVDKLQMSISMLMSSHETEMSSLQNSLESTKSQITGLEDEVATYSHQNEVLQSLVAKINAELKDIKASKDAIVSSMSDLIAQNKAAFEKFQGDLCTSLAEMKSHQGATEHIFQDKSTLLSEVPQHSSTVLDIENIPDLSSGSILNSSIKNLSPTTDSLATVSHYGKLSKSDLVAKLSDQTKYELVLRKNLEEARQSLVFYRSAIDNIIDCLGTAMPDVKKWATDFLNSGDREFSQRLDALINNESALQRRCHALEISEKALKESFETKEKEYQSSIQHLEDMIALLKSNKAKLTEELKFKTSSSDSDTERQLADLKQKVYELESSVRKLRAQNEEIQFAYEQECDRRQHQEEERFQADQRFRLNTVEVVRETEYLSKIASLETKISSLLKTQKHMDATIESLRHQSREDEYKLRIETLERSERALQRKIEILQQSDNNANLSQYENNLDRPEDLLRQKIWEMENMETHLKQQVSDLEHDREELHEIARSDKNIIHELNIQLAELSLANKNLKAQVARLEHTEEILYSKLDTHESRVSELEEKLRESLENEKSMRFQLEDVEYSEDSLRFRAGNMERTLEGLQDNEAGLKKTIDDLTLERQQAFKEVATCKSLYKELEREQVELRTKLMETESREITLKGKISELSAIEASLQVHIREVELEKQRLSSRALRLEKSADEMRDNLSSSFLGKDELNNRIQAIMSAEKEARRRVADVEDEKFELEKELQDVKFKYVQSQSQGSKRDTDGSKQSEQLAAALANQKQTEAQVVRLEAVVAAYESRQTSGIVERENFQLNAENKNLKDKLKAKEKDVRDLEEKVNRLSSSGGSGGGTYKINKLQTEVKELQTQLKQCEESRSSLEEMLHKLKHDKGSCEHDAEISSLKSELRRAKESNGGYHIHTHPVRRQSKDPKSSASQGGSRGNNGNLQDSLRTRCLKELVSKVNQSPSAEEKMCGTSTEQEDDQADAVVAADTAADTASVASDDAAEIASQSSIWEKLAPPVRSSPRPVMSAALIRPASPSPVPAVVVTPPTSPPHTTAESVQSEVPEESPLWEHLELYEPKRSASKVSSKVEIVFDEGPIAPIYSSARKSLTQTAIDVRANESADEVSDIEEVEVNATTKQEDYTPSKPTEPDEMDHMRQSPAFSTLSAQATQVVDVDVARLKQTVADLERRLKSRDTEIRMLRNQLREIEKESNLSGDVYTLKTKLKAMQADVEAGEKKISSLRSDIIAKDKNLTNRHREIVELRLELRKYTDQQRDKGSEGEAPPVSTVLSPGSKQRSIQMCTSPGRQTTIQQEPTHLYKSMIESKDSHIQELTKRLADKTAAVARLERQLTDIKIASPSPDNPDAAKFKYLDDKYTEAATRCYNMKLERDEWKTKYEDLLTEHTKCKSGGNSKCVKCKQLKQEIRRLQRDLQHYRKKVFTKKKEEGLGSYKSVTHPIGTHTPEVGSQATCDEISSLSEDTLTHTCTNSTPARPHHHTSNGASLPFTSSQGSAVRRSSNTSNRAARPKVGRTFKARSYEVISDYNPQYFSTSGRRAQEVALNQGQKVKVLEQADEKGYCKAEVNGKIRLVPIKYLQLCDTRMTLNREQTMVEQPTVHQPPRFTTESDGNIRPVRESLSQTFPSNRPSVEHTRARSVSPVRLNTSAPPVLPTPLTLLTTPTLFSSAVSTPIKQAHAGISSPKSSTGPELLRKPRAPTDLSVEIVANKKMYVEWKYINYLDYAAKSNGTTVTGFRVSLNGHATTDITSPYTTVAAIEISKGQAADLHTVSVQALGAKNTNSPLTHVTVTPYATGKGHKVGGITVNSKSHDHNHRQSDGDKSGRKRLFMAYYDYNPVKQGPYSKGYKKSCDDELALKTGDFVVVYGEAKPNGFYWAEINGKTGCVPESFIKQVPAENAKRFGLYDNDVYLYK